MTEAGAVRARATLRATGRRRAAPLETSRLEGRGALLMAHTGTRTQQSRAECNRLRGDLDGGRRHARGGKLSVGTFPLVQGRRSSGRSSLWRDTAAGGALLWQKLFAKAYLNSALRVFTSVCAIKIGVRVINIYRVRLYEYLQTRI